MKKEYLYVWAGWLAAALLAEFTAAPRSVWVALMALFVVFEGVGVLVRKKPGDTLSEAIWDWVGERHVGRALQAGVLGLWFAWHFYLLVARIEPEGSMASVGPGLLAGALAVWLIPHFVTRGKTG
jgi:hypothetical protein